MKCYPVSSLAYVHDLVVSTNVQQLTTAFDLAGAFHFASPTSRDAALEIALLPGAYTLQATSLDGGSGTVLAEAYEVP